MIWSARSRLQVLAARPVAWPTAGDIGLLAAVLWLAGATLFAITGTLLCPYDPGQVDLDRRLLPPGSWRGDDLFLLGTDQLGRDYLSQIIAGTRASLGIGILSAALATAVGIVVGGASGFLGGRVDAGVTRLVDAQMSFPGLLFTMLLIVSVGPSVPVIILVLAFSAWPAITRLARGIAMEIRTKAFIDAVIALDADTARIVRRHVIPNLLGPVLVLGTIQVATLMLASAGLDFLGLGLQPPDTSWGVLVANGRDSIQVAGWLVALPGAAIFITTLSVSALALRARKAQGGSRRVKVSATEPNSWSGAWSADVATVVEEPTTSSQGPALAVEVRGLVVGFETAHGLVPVVKGVSLSVPDGRVVALVGESGAGKSVTARAIMGLVETPGHVTSGTIALLGQDVTALRPRERRAMNGRVISMVQQDAVASLNPVMTVGAHLDQILARGPRPVDRRARSIELLRRVGISDPPRRLDQYPHQLSGGMSQRIAIALAVANQPRILVADEPTTALDVTYQAQVMDLLAELSTASGMSVLLITHDLGLAAERADRVVVMYGGEVMEAGPVEDVIEHPYHPYTRALLVARPSIAAGRQRLRPIPGTPPALGQGGTGCPFAPRCELVLEMCTTGRVPVLRTPDGRESRCHRAAELRGSV